MGIYFLLYFNIKKKKKNRISYHVKRIAFFDFLQSVIFDITWERPIYIMLSEKDKYRTYYSIKKHI